MMDIWGAGFVDQDLATFDSEVYVRYGRALATLSLVTMSLAGPCGIPGLIPGSRFFLDPDPDPGKLSSEPGSGSKPGFAFLYKFGQTCSYFANLWEFLAMFRNVQ